MRQQVLKVCVGGSRLLGGDVVVETKARVSANDSVGSVGAQELHRQQILAQHQRHVRDVFATSLPAKELQRCDLSQCLGNHVHNLHEVVG